MFHKKTLTPWLIENVCQPGWVKVEEVKLLAIDKWNLLCIIAWHAIWILLWKSVRSRKYICHQAYHTCSKLKKWKLEVLILRIDFIVYFSILCTKIANNQICAHRFNTISRRHWHTQGQEGWSSEPLFQDLLKILSFKLINTKEDEWKITQT